MYEPYSLQFAVTLSGFFAWHKKETNVSISWSFSTEQRHDRFIVVFRGIPLTHSSSAELYP